jgi:hypothetical protein
MIEIVAQKRCNKCGEWKDRDCFSKHKRHGDGLSTNCKECQRAYKNNNLQRDKERAHLWQKNNRAKVNAYRVRRKDDKRKYKLKYVYGITVEDYDRMFREQNGKCATCGSDNNGKRLVVDHDHKTGKVRGLLCASCNVAIGFMKDDESIVMKVFHYLTRNR